MIKIIGYVILVKHFSIFGRTLKDKQSMNFFSDASTPRSGTASRSSFVKSIALLIIVATFMAWLNIVLHFNGFTLNDYHEYCQIARNFYEGNGYSTSVLRPIAYKYFQTLPQPEVTRMPIYPFFLSLSFHVFGPNDNAVVIFNGIFYVVLVAIIFLIGYELTKNTFISMIAGLLTAFMESFLRYTITAEPNIFYSAMIAVFFYLFLKYPQKLLLYGIVLGVLYQLRANTLFVFLGFLAAMVLKGNSWGNRSTAFLKLTAGYIIGLIPYMIRNYGVVGKPMFSLYKYSLLLYTAGFPQYLVWTQITDVDPTAYVLSHPGEFFSKSYAFFMSLASDSIAFYHPVVLLLIGAGFFLPADDSRPRLLRLIVIAGILVQTVLVLPVGPVPYYYMFFFPIMITVALANVRRYTGKYTEIMLSVVLAIFIFTTMPFWKSPKKVNPFIPVGAQIAELTDKEDIILTDIPWEITWYANRRTIWLPYDIETYKKISTTLKPKYVILTGYSYAPYKDNLWRRVYSDPDFAKKTGFELKKVILFYEQPFAFMYEVKD